MEPKNQNTPDLLVLTVESSAIRLFFQLFGKGVIVPGKPGCSIRQLLCDQFGIESSYLNEKIQTLFLDGKPVDNVDATLVPAEATLALSGAMPGLMGATLRKGGFYAAFREGISHQETQSSMEAGGNRICLKIFNTLQKDLVPTFLSTGILIRASELKAFLDARADDIVPKLLAARFGDDALDHDELDRWLDEEKMLLLKIISQE